MASTCDPNLDHTRTTREPFANHVRTICEPFGTQAFPTINMRCSGQMCAYSFLTRWWHVGLAHLLPVHNPPEHTACPRCMHTSQQWPHVSTELAQADQNNKNTAHRKNPQPTPHFPLNSPRQIRKLYTAASGLSNLTSPARGSACSPNFRREDSRRRSPSWTAPPRPREVP